LKISILIWLEEIVGKITSKHHVTPKEVREIFQSATHFRYVEKGHRSAENVFAVLGKTEAGRFLIVFFIYKKGNQALILPARDMTDAERKRYEKK
jgi:uncharacterized DUF497 family protein